MFAVFIIPSIHEKSRLPGLNNSSARKARKHGSKDTRDEINLREAGELRFSLH